MRMAAVDCAPRSAVSAQKWMILTTADTYGPMFRPESSCRICLEATYHDVDEVVAAVKNSVGRLVATPQLPATRCCDWRA